MGEEINENEASPSDAGRKETTMTDEVEMSRRTVRSWVSWWGLRCHLKMCPHMPTGRGYMCIHCLDEKLWNFPPSPAGVGPEGDDNG